MSGISRNYITCLLIISLFICLLNTGCASNEDALANFVANVLDKIVKAQHAHSDIVGRSEVWAWQTIWWFFDLYLAKTDNVPSEFQTKALEFYPNPHIEEAYKQVEASKEYLKQRYRQIKPAASNPYFDSNLDGVWIGRLHISGVDIWAIEEKIYFHFILITNHSSNNKLFASILFLDLTESIIQNKNIWSAIYTNELKLGPGKYGAKYTIGLDFDSEDLMKIYPARYYLKVKLQGNVGSSNKFDGKQFIMGGSTAADHDPNIYLSLICNKVLQDNKFYGAWESGCMKSQRSEGEILGPFYHPMILFVYDYHTASSGSYTDSYFHYSVFNVQDDNPEMKKNNFKFFGKNFITTVNIDFNLSGDKLKGNFWNMEDLIYEDHTLTKVGNTGKKIILRAVKPKRVALNQVGKEVSVTVKGKNFYQGAMVFFDNPNIEITDIEYQNHKKLKVTLKPISAIKSGTKIGVRVINPDNSAATVTGKFIAK
jgi:hypothetical protein